MNVPSPGSTAARCAGVAIAMLMPHAPVLVPAVGGERLRHVASTVRAMRETARRLIAAEPEALVAVSPHSPRRSGAFGIWAGHTLHGSLAQFGAPDARLNLPIDHKLAAAVVTETKTRGVTTWEISGEPLDHGAVVPLWFAAEAGWRGPTMVLSLNYPGEGRLRELGEAIAAASHRINRRIAFLASGDMSHRLTPDAPAGFHPRAGTFDREFMTIIEHGAYRELSQIDPGLQNLAAEDALDSTLIAVAATNCDASGHQVLSYEGPFGVGYGVAILFAQIECERLTAAGP